MIKKLHVGKDFSLPLDLVTSTLIVYGGKGMGKTNFGSVLVEELSAAELRWSALDPMGVWWGLRHSADGKGPGVQCVILGGVHGDIPIEPTGGSIVADLVIEEDANVIVDISRKPNGEAWETGQKIRFVRDYGQRLFQRQSGLVDKQRREPIFQIIDEAARFLPQSVRSNEDDIIKCLSVWAQIVEEARNVGIGVGLLTQRSARLNKDVAELADVMVAFRTVGPNSVRAVIDWLGEHVSKERMKWATEQLRELPRGCALVVSPGWLKFEDTVEFRARQTFDSSATPKPGESSRRVTGKAAKPDLAKYAERMKETIEKVKENDPKALKQKIAELQKELQKKQPAAGKTPAAPDPEKLKAAIDKAVAAAIGNRDREWKTQVFAYTQQLTEALRGLAKSANAVAFIPPAKSKVTIPTNSYISEGHGGDIIPVARLSPEMQRKVLPQPPEYRRAVKSSDNGHTRERLPPGEKAVLIAAAQYENGVERDQLSVLTGYKRSSRDAYIQRLREKGHVSIQGNGIVATEGGIRSLGSDYEPLPKGEELQRYWINRLPAGERKVLELLIESYPDPVERQLIDERTGYKRSSRDAYLQRLSSRRLVEATRGESVKASDVLFEEAASPS